MNQKKLVVVLVLGLALVVSGCNKKAADQANLSSTGFENTGTPAELAQLPQANATTNQQGAIEVLPIETSPITQGVPASPMASTINNSSSMNLTAGNTSNGTTLSASITPSSSAKETVNSPASVSHNKEIQTALKNAGYYNGSIDGKIGPGSKRAIEAFQSSKGLKADGKVGHKTWRALEPFLSGPSSTTFSAASTTGTSTTQEGN